MQFRHLKITEHRNKLPPLFAHYFESKVGRKHLLKYSISLNHYAPTPLPHNVTHKVNNHNDCQHAVAFWKNRSVASCVLQEISNTL